MSNSGVTGKSGDWMEDSQNLANIGHALAGYAVLVTAALFTSRLTYINVVEAVLLTYVLVKEFWYDLRYETGETVASSVEDAAGYLVGNAAGWIVFFVHYLAVRA